MTNIIFNMSPILKYIIGWLLLFMFLNYCQLDKSHVMTISVVGVIIMISLDILTIYEYDQLILKNTPFLSKYAN